MLFRSRADCPGGSAGGRGGAPQPGCTSSVAAWLLAILATGPVGAAPCEAAEADPAPASVAVQATTRPLLVAHCGSCHGEDDAQAGFRVDTLPATIDSVADADRWQRVLGVTNAGEMPPKEEKQLASAAKADLLDDLAHAVMAARRMQIGRAHV